MPPLSRAEMLAGLGPERGSAFRGAGPPAPFERLDVSRPWALAGWYPTPHGKRTSGFW
jgi:hypothetical protein